jgi:FAD/FMN-containing dehydrogenase
MHWITPGDSEYDERRALFNAMIDKRPALIAACTDIEDVRDALVRAHRDHLEIAVRAGGHSVAGMSTNNDGIVIDVRPMKHITIDPALQIARVGAGVTWGEFDAEAQKHGLATTGGRASTTGVAGFTLGGGSGWLERQFGLACDNLFALDLVTTDGRHIHADAAHHPELLWASRGGGGNFGVVTSLEFHLHPVGPEILGGLLIWPGAATAEIVTAYRDWASDAPRQMGSGVVGLSGPPEEFIPPELQGQPIIAIAVIWNGDKAEGEELIGRLRALSPAVDLVGPIPYTQMQQMLDDPPGMRQYWSADFHDEFSDEAIEIFVDSCMNRPAPTIQQILLRWGGRVSEYGTETSPMAQRSAQWITHPFATWESPADDQPCIQWAKSWREAIAPHTSGGVYLNFIGDEGHDRVVAAFGHDNYMRLAAVKAEYDPMNLLKGNQNIRPHVNA